MNEKLMRCELDTLVMELGIDGTHRIILGRYMCYIMGKRKEGLSMRKIA